MAQAQSAGERYRVQSVARALRILELGTPHTLTTRRALSKDLAVIRARGYSIDDEEDFEGGVCVGTAIRNDTDGPVAAISVTMLKGHATRGWPAHAGRALVVSAEQISRRLGYSDGGVSAGRQAEPRVGKTTR